MRSASLGPWLPRKDNITGLSLTSSEQGPVALLLAQCSVIPAPGRTFREQMSWEAKGKGHACRFVLVRSVQT